MGSYLSKPTTVVSLDKNIDASIKNIDTPVDDIKSIEEIIGEIEAVKSPVVDDHPESDLQETKSSVVHEEPKLKIVNLDGNPWIHGTTSRILSLLPLTNFELVEPIMMIEKYHLAPITGEITGGGLSRVWDRCEPRFGRIFSEGPNSYDLNKVRNYTGSYIQTDDWVSDPISNLKKRVDWGSNITYSNINIILIYAMRCRNLGYSIQDIITPELIQEMRLIRNTFALLLFINTYLKPRYQYPDYESPQFKKQVDDLEVMSHYLTLDHF
jgi:hypothetical protein